MRQCIELGYHRCDKVLGLDADPVRLQLRKRVFWSAWSIDCLAATILGRPLALHAQEFDCEVREPTQDVIINELPVHSKLIRNYAVS